MVLALQCAASIFLLNLYTGFSSDGTMDGSSQMYLKMIHKFTGSVFFSRLISSFTVILWCCADTDRLFGVNFFFRVCIPAF